MVSRIWMAIESLAVHGSMGKSWVRMKPAGISLGSSVRRRMTALIPSA